jgi:hypothetical protein
MSAAAAAPDKKQDANTPAALQQPPFDVKETASVPAFHSALQVVSRRRCCRAFLPKLVPPASVIHDVIAAARNSSSSQNNQPWYGPY